MNATTETIATLAEYEAPKTITGIYGTVEIMYHPAGDYLDIDGNISGHYESGYTAVMLDGKYRGWHRGAAGLRINALKALYNEIADREALDELDTANIHI
jgi:hypothetical protein